jgi:ligand-binding sensor domain-containing protein/signal transduction histidine kinase
MRRASHGWFCWAGLALLGLLFPRGAAALDPRKRFTQYSRTLWTQEHGLPQDTIRAIAQTPDGYLWLGTDEGLARFDGYDFAVFNKANRDLPANSITALAVSADGSLWIATSAGLTRYKGQQFRTYTAAQDLPDNNVSALFADGQGALWIVTGLGLSRFEDEKFTNYAPGPDMPVRSPRAVCEDRHHALWVAGIGGVARMESGKFVTVIDGATLGANVAGSMTADSHGNIWIAGSLGLIERMADGRLRRFGAPDGLPNSFTRAVLEDRDGNIWVGTNEGLARSQSNRFGAPAGAGGLVRTLFEDREGNLWVGSNSGLERLRDDVFSVLGTPENLPSDQPNTILQDRAGRIWVGFHDGGLLRFSEGASRTFTSRDGLPEGEIFSIRETPSGDLLLGSRGGLARMHGTQFSILIPEEPLARRTVFEGLEDSRGRVWMATPGGLGEMRGKRFHMVIPAGLQMGGAVVTLCESRDGSLWGGTWGKGVWHIQDRATKLYSTDNGLPSNEIRALEEDPDGTLWIGTFGGGLAALRNGKFLSFTEKDGLLSDNIASLADDGESLWLGTTRGICRIPKRQLNDFAAGKRGALEPTNFGVADGLRSAQCSPGYPTEGGARRTADGRMWFATSRGLAVFDPRVHPQSTLAPEVHLMATTGAGRVLDLNAPARLDPDDDRVLFRYTGIHLSAPQRVQYSYMLNGLDRAWVKAGTRRLINYNSLTHGQYTFAVRAEVPGGPAGNRLYSFEVLPYFYQTAWFRVLFAAALLVIGVAAYRLRLRQIRYRFALVLEERARLAREIHDTLTQGFVGISAQLDAVAMSMPENGGAAQTYLEMARRMSRHSLTEARRSLIDLRTSVLEGQDLAAALESGTRLWTAGSGVQVDVQVDGERRDLSQDVEQHLLRIAQEAVANTLKHAGANRIWIQLHMEVRKLYLRIRDNGRGFEQEDVFSSLGGHFGLIGMRERASRLGGELRLTSRPGQGTEVEVTVPLP